ncbi:MAG: NAD(P)H-hydrate dehydratase [Phycisphaerales bacterium]|nr:NAD(P)H-hydrate dehydratase [Phycisphaerales bacterium]
MLQSPGMTSLVLPPRPEDGHKGTFGSVCVIGGCKSEDGLVMLGAPALAANAALRSGCGQVVLATPQPLLAHALSLAPTATGVELPVDDVSRLMPSQSITLLDQHCGSCRAIALGMGFGQGWSQQQLVTALIAREDRPIVLDADGLNALASLEQGALDIHSPLVMTPHVGEFARLASAFNIHATGSLEEDAAALAQTCGAIVVLKSHTTVISNGIQTERCDQGGVELATGGSGDVLAGLIAGLIAQYGVQANDHLFDAALLGVHIHALAGKAVAEHQGNTGMLATDLLGEIPKTISKLRKG